MTGEVPLEKAVLEQQGSFPENRNIRQLFGRRVSSINTEKNQDAIEGENTLEYDKLLLASGAAQSVPPIPGIEVQGVFTFYTLEDAAAIIEAVKRESGPGKVVIIGGGFIGVTAAIATKKLGLETTVVEVLDNVLSTMLDNRGGEIAGSLLQASGISVITGTGVREVVSGKSGEVSGIVLNSGRELECGTVIIATGVKPAIDYIEGTGISTETGILVDQHMATSVKDIYAAGDACECAGRLKEGFLYSPNWLNAGEQGETAGDNMTGGSRIYNGSTAVNSIVINGTPVVSMGMVDPEAPGDRAFTAERKLTGAYRKIVTSGGRLIGAVLIKDLERAGTLHQILREKIDISGIENRIVEDSVELISLLLDMRKDDMEGEIGWPLRIGMKEKYKKKIDVEKWERRGG